MSRRLKQLAGNVEGILIGGVLVAMALAYVIARVLGVHVDWTLP